MEKLIKKYEAEARRPGTWLTGATRCSRGIDDSVTWNRSAGESGVLGEVIAALSINSILFTRPAEPYRSIIHFLAERAFSGDGILRPEDSETRTFLHDIPVIGAFDAGDISAALKKRKSVIVKDRGIASYGIVSPEQAFVTYSSVCFSCYVRFFTDYYYDMKHGRTTDRQTAIARSAAESYRAYLTVWKNMPSMAGPFSGADEIMKADSEAGRLTVESRMVDSFFGNVSYSSGGMIYISQTGSSLDELEGNIDACPVDGSTTAAITASSEYSAHKSIYGMTGWKAILHGHPKFSANHFNALRQGRLPRQGTVL